MHIKNQKPPQNYLRAESHSRFGHYFYSNLYGGAPRVPGCQKIHKNMLQIKLLSSSSSSLYISREVAQSFSFLSQMRTNMMYGREWRLGGLTAIITAKRMKIWSLTEFWTPVKYACFSISTWSCEKVDNKVKAKTPRYSVRFLFCSFL